MALNNNRINTKLKEPQEAAMTASLGDYRQTLLTVAQTLTPVERKRLLKIDRVNRVFVEESIDVLENLSELMPAYLKAADIRMDLELYVQMAKQEDALQAELRLVQDTKILAGAEAYQAALTIYRLVEGCQSRHDGS